MSNFRKFISVSAVAVLAATNLLAPLSYADAATAWSELVDADFHTNPLEFNMPNHDVTLYAVMAPNDYYVAFNGNTNTSGEMGQQHFVYDEEKALSGNQYGKTGYSFGGWNTDANGGGSGYTDEQEVKNLAESGTVNLYAQWNVNSYNIIYKLNDASGSSSGVLTPTPDATRTYEQTLSVSNPTRTGYTFSGWDISGMDTEQHTIGSETSNAASVSGTKATSFQHLRATSGTVEFLAQWSKALTEYKVKHYQQNLENDQYPTNPTLTETLSGYTDTPATSESQDYEGFDTPIITKDPTDGNINADKSTVITYQYPRKSYILTLIAGTGVALVKGTGTVNAVGVETSDKDTGSFKYQDSIELSYVLKDGYQTPVWSGYLDTASSFTMPHENITKELNASTITYTVTGNYHGGTGASPYVDVYSRTYNVEDPQFTLPTELSRPHSTFSGWIVNDGDTPVNPLTVGPNATGNRVYEAVWDCVDGYKYHTDTPTEACMPKDDTPYTVEHYKQELDGSYTLVDTDHPTGTTDQSAVWTGKTTYTGFSGGYLSGEEQTISGDPAHPTVVQVRYDRNSYNTTITDPVGGEPTAVISATASGANSQGSQIKYGDTVTLNANIADGYEFEYWEVNGGAVDVTNSGNRNGATFTMPASVVTITPHLKQISYSISYNLNSGSVAGTNPTSYTVESGDIKLIDPTRDHSVFQGWSGTDHSTLFSGDVVAIASGSIGNKSFEAIWGCDAGYHAEGNSCVANEYSIKVEYNDDEHSNETLSGTYDQWTEIPNPTKDGYIFSGWTISGMSGNVTHYVGGSGSTTNGTSASDVMGTGFKNLTTEYPNGEVTFTAVWVADTVEYRVHHMIEGLDVDTYSQTGEVEVHTGKSDSSVTFTDLDITLAGFTYSGGNLSGGSTWPNAARTETTIDRHGNTHIYLYYDRNRHTVTVYEDANTASVSGGGTYDYEHEVTVTATPKTGYHFKQWTGSPAPAPTEPSGS